MVLCPVVCLVFLGVAVLFVLRVVVVSVFVFAWLVCSFCFFVFSVSCFVACCLFGVPRCCCFACFARGCCFSFVLLGLSVCLFYVWPLG